MTIKSSFDVGDVVRYEGVVKDTDGPAVITEAGHWFSPSELTLVKKAPKPEPEMWSVIPHRTPDCYYVRTPFGWVFWSKFDGFSGIDQYRKWSQIQ